MTIVMHLELILKYFKPAFKDFKVFTGLWLNHPTTSTGGRVAEWPGGRVGGLSETGNKAISASIEIEVQLSGVEAELGKKCWFSKGEHDR